MLRWVWRIFCDVSLLISVTALVFWVRSYFVSEVADLREVWWTPSAAKWVEYHYRQTTVACCLGELRVNRQHTYSNEIAARQLRGVMDGAQLYFHHISPPTPSPRGKGITYLVDQWGFRVGYLNAPQTKMSPWAIDVVGGAAPMWSVVVIFAVLPAVRAVRWMRRKPKREGKYCEKCGYDLRASRERCPECGRMVETSDKAAGSQLLRGRCL